MKLYQDNGRKGLKVMMLIGSADVDVWFEEKI